MLVCSRCLVIRVLSCVLVLFTAVVMAKPLLNKLELDDVLVKFKVYGHYHAIAGGFLTLAVVAEAMWYCNYVFVAEEVAYRCADNSSKADEITKSSNFSNTKEKELWCRNPELCSEWLYENPDSFMAEFQLACQDWKRTLVGSMHNFGYMVGLLIVGPLSDRFGRKTLIIATGVSAGILGLAKSFVTSYWLYVALEFIESAIGDFASPLYMLAVEIVATKSRVTFTSICNLGFGIGGALLPLLAWRNPYWRTLLRVMYAPGLLSIFYIYILDESPRWLLATGNKEATVKIIRKAAKLNKIVLEENLDMISHEKTEEELSFIRLIADTFRSKTILKRFFVCTIWWIACTYVNYGLIFNSVILAGDKYVNFAISSAMDIPSNIIAAIIITKFNRRGPLVISFMACAVLCIGQPFIPSDHLWLVILMYMLGKLLSSIFFNIIYIFTSELFPTNTRNSMHALCSSVGRIGSIIAPQTPLLMVYWTGLPTMTFGAASLIAGLATFLVPDTADYSLPDTVGQAEAMEIETKTLSTKVSFSGTTDCTSL